MGQPSVSDPRNHLPTPPRPASCQGPAANCPCPARDPNVTRPYRQTPRPRGPLFQAAPPSLCLLSLPQQCCWVMGEVGKQVSMCAIGPGRQPQGSVLPALPSLPWKPCHAVPPAQAGTSEGAGWPALPVPAQVSREREGWQAPTEHFPSAKHYHKPLTYRISCTLRATAGR